MFTHGFMVWNLVLAAVPAALAVVLFRRNVARTPFWWGLLGVWVLFLPNAPYVLTDVVHMLDDLRGAPTRLHGLSVLTSYALFFAAGVGAYVFAIQRSRVFWHSVLPDRAVPFVLIALHGVCVIAMYVGHFWRFNSWDAVVDPGALVSSMMHVPSVFTVALLAAMFLVSGIAAWTVNEIAGRVRGQLSRLR